MQRIRLTRNLLTELGRCKRSFVLSLLWHGIDNESLSQKGGLQVDDEAIKEVRRQLLYGLEGISNSLASMDNCEPISCSANDMQATLDLTANYLSQPGPLVLVDGLLEGGSYVVPFSVIVVRPDGMWEVYHQSTKSAGLENLKDFNKALDTAMSDAAPLMYVLSRNYSDKVARFAVIAANKSYLTPYPDPITGEVRIDPNEAMYFLDIDPSCDNIGDYLGYNDPEAVVFELQQELAMNPYYIPEGCMQEQKSKCNGAQEGYECPFKTYCKIQLEEQMPDSVRLYLGGVHSNKLIKRGINTMTELLELSYIEPTLGEVGDEILLRELRAYEQQLLDVQRNVDDIFG